jgi:hypothetical protein
MTLPQSLSQLALDALYERHMAKHGCFVWNEDSQRLGQFGESTLPPIEGVVWREVVPNCPASSDVLSRRFPGLLGVLIAYFEVARGTEQLDRAAVFLRGLHGSLRAEAMRAINNVWLLRQPPTQIPEGLMQVIREVAEYGSGELRQVADWLIRREKEECP